MIPVREPSIEAYHELKEEGEISEKRSVAFNALKEYAESSETDRWPTAVELYEWAQGNLDSEVFPFSRFGNFKPRITELTPGSDATDIELIEYKEEKREQDSDTTKRKARPVKIKEYQSTLSEEEGEAAELRQQEGTDSATVSDDVDDEEEIEVPYQVDGGSEVRMGSPEEAIQNADDLDSLEETLERNGLLEEYREDIAAVRGDDEVGLEQEENYADSSEENQSQDSDSIDTVEVDGEDYLLDPREESETEEDQESAEPEEDDEEDSEQKVLMRDGEVIV